MDKLLVLYAKRIVLKKKEPTLRGNLLIVRHHFSIIYLH